MERKGPFHNYIKLLNIPINSQVGIGPNVEHKIDHNQAEKLA